MIITIMSHRKLSCVSTGFIVHAIDNNHLFYRFLRIHILAIEHSLVYNNCWMICILCLMLHLSRFTRDSLPVSALTRRLGRQVDDTNPRIDMFLRR